MVMVLGLMHKHLEVFWNARYSSENVLVDFYYKSREYISIILDQRNFPGGNREPGNEERRDLR